MLNIRPEDTNVTYLLTTLVIAISLLKNVLNCSRIEYETLDGKSRPKYLMLIQRVEKEGPFTALNFFTVDRHGSFSNM